MFGLITQSLVKDREPRVKLEILSPLVLLAVFGAFERLDEGAKKEIAKEFSRVYFIADEHSPISA